MAEHILKITLLAKNNNSARAYGRIRLSGPGLCQFSTLRSIRPHRTRILALTVPMVSIQKSQYQVALLVFQEVDGVGELAQSYTLDLPMEGEYELDASVS